MARPWKDIARELAREANPKRRAELSEELNLAIAEQGPFAATSEPQYQPKAANAS